MLASMSDEKPPPKQLNIQVQIDEETAMGQYTNLVMLNHTETEFCLDFLFIQPQQPRAKAHSRVITSPMHAKQLLRALSENIALYENKFGQIPEPMQSRPKLVH